MDQEFVRDRGEGMYTKSYKGKTVWLAMKILIDGLWLEWCGYRLTLLYVKVIVCVMIKW